MPITYLCCGARTRYGTSSRAPPAGRGRPGRGALSAGPADEALVAGSRAAARQHTLPHERLDGDEIRRRYPMFRLPEGFAGVFEPEGGYLLCEQAIVEM